MRFLNDVPKILDAMVAATVQNKENGYSYNDVDDMFNDWIMPYIETLPFDSWISEITNGTESHMITAAMAIDERFIELLENYDPTPSDIVETA